MFADPDSHAAQEEAEENYFVSMTDMMVGMLFLFIILLMVFALNYRVGDDDSKRIKDCLISLLQKNASLSSDINSKVNEIQGKVRSQIQALQLAADQRRRLLSDLRHELQIRGVSVDIDERNGVLHLTEQSVRFEPDRYDMSATDLDHVTKIAAALSVVLPKFAACTTDDARRCEQFKGAALDTIFIEGHTDSTGNSDFNWILSAERAISTYRAVLTKYPALTQFRNRRGQEIVSVSGYSSTRPIDSQNNRAAWAANRRIDLRFVMDAETTINLQDLLLLNDDVKAQLGRLTQISQESVDQCK